MSRTKLIPMLILILLISSCKYFKQDLPPIPEPTVEFKIKVLDENGNPIKANYSLEIYNNMPNEFYQYKKGVTENTFTIIDSNAQINKVYKLTYWDSNHYRKEEIIKYPKSDYLNTLKFDEEDRKGKINITFIGNLEVDRENLIILNISVKEGSIKRLSACFDYSMRIIDINPKDDFIMCDSYWINYSYYPHNNSVYYLPPKKYWCYADNYEENCEIVKYSKCFYNKMQVPQGIKATKCFKIGKDITDYFEYPILIKTMPFFREDYLRVFLTDDENNFYEFEKRW